MNKSSPPSLSIVVPCHNEQEVLSDTCKELLRLCNLWKDNDKIINFEIVLVNNGSTDSSLEVMEKFHSQNKNIVIVDLWQDSGYQGSITAGVFEAKNDMVVSIDADLQDDPEKIEEMIEKYEEGHQMVLGIRGDRKRDSFLKRITAHFYYKLMIFMGAKSVYNHGDFRLLSRDVVEQLRKFPERVRYLRAMIFLVSSDYATVKYDRRKRKLGKSKFSPIKLLTLAFDGITSFSNFPIRLIFAGGVVMFLLSTAGFIYVFYEKFVNDVSVPGWASLALIFLFFGGIQNLSIGIVGEYMSKMYIETKQRPVYLIRKIYRYEK